MKNPQIKVVDISTGIETITDMTDEQMAQWESEKIAQETKFAAQEAKDVLKAELLAKLGISQDEAKLLLS